MSLTDKAEKIAAAKLPVNGLGFGDGFITLNGLPFKQASDAERLRTSVAIAMALNPKLRLILVKDGSCLSPKSMKILEDMANEKDFSVWIERQVGTGGTGFVIEDGRIVGQELPTEPEKKDAVKTAAPSKPTASSRTARLKF